MYKVQNMPIASLLFILLGILLVLWGLSYFIMPLSFIFVGAMLVKHGFSYSRYPLTYYIQRFMTGGRF